ncbi:hypothetical protein MJI20_30565, partial [Salmonella enterica subsp. enterica serovar Anatum]|nr:hypothetical protein [Salmonella enterica subsp. enterica serovar Anatum]
MVRIAHDAAFARHREHFSVGAGTLFLPIQLGSAGAIVLFITALVAWPLTYWPHKALCQFI